MKKNKFMKLASGLLVLCLMTTCVIGATLAKYVTANTTTDQARVAKWGVRISAVANSAFKTQYDTEDAEYTGDLSVKSSSTDEVVAPGTEGNAAQFSISGTPEVAVRLSFKMENEKDIFLKAGTYVYTDGATVTLDEVYNPVKFTFKKGGVAVTGMENVTLATLATALADYTVDYPAGTDLSHIEAYTLEWTWAFDGNDKADTLLGDIAANVYSDINGGALVENTDYCTTVSYSLTITATQID